MGSARCRWAAIAALPTVESYAFRSVTERVLEQCRRDPAATAVVHEDQRLSYGDLEGLSGRMAWVLRRLGVGADIRVGLCMERSTGLVASLLGILRSGGACAPLDPAYSEARLRRYPSPMPGCTLSWPTVNERGGGCPACSMGSAWWSWRIWSKARAEPFGDAAPHPLQPAWRLHSTSGSTGRPKGVGISHDNAWRGCWI